MLPPTIFRNYIYTFAVLALLLFSLPGKGQTVPCDAATAQTIETGGLCIGCYVDNPKLAVDTSSATFSTLHVVLGLLGSYTQQQLIFPTKSSIGDSLRIFLTAPVGLLDLTLLGGISVATYNGNVYNDDRTAINSGLLHVRLIAGYQVVLTWAPDKLFDKVEIRLNSGVLQLLDAISINYAHRIVPQPLAALSPVRVCSGKPALLSVTGPTGVTFDWYKQPAGGTPVFTGANYNTGPVTADSNYYVQATRNGCSNLSRTRISVKPDPLPSTPQVTYSIADICSGTQATFIATGVTGITHRWFNEPLGGSHLAANDTFTTTSLATNTSFYTEALDTLGCVSSTRTIVTANILPPGPGISMSAAQTLGGTGGDQFSAIAKAVDGGFLVAGNTASNDGDIGGQNHGLLDFWLVKLDAANNKKWSKVIGTSGQDSLTGIAATKDKKYIICGNYNLGTTAASGQIIGIDSNANILWSKSATLFNQFVGNASDGNNCIIIGTSANTLQLTLLNSAGTVLKTANYPGNYAIDQVRFAQTDDKGLLIAGSTVSGSVYGKDAFVTRIDSNLNRQWEQVFLSEGDDVKVDIHRTSDRCYTLTSVTRDNAGLENKVRIIQLTPNGTIQFLKFFGPLPVPGMNRISDNTAAATASANTRNVLTLFDRPQEPVFVPRKDNTTFAIPTDYLNNGSARTFQSPVGSNGALYLIELDSTGEIVALQQDTTNVFNPRGAVRTSDGGALMVGGTFGVAGKAVLAKIDPPSCLPAILPLLVQGAETMLVRESVPVSNLKEKEIMLTVAPNPFFQTLNCRYQIRKTGKVVLQLINVSSGQNMILRNETATEGIYNLQINTEHYPAGIYILQLDQEGRKVKSRLVKLN